MPLTPSTLMGAILRDVRLAALIRRYERHAERTNDTLKAMQEQSSAPAARVGKVEHPPRVFAGHRDSSGVADSPIAPGLP